MFQASKHFGHFKVTFITFLNTFIMSIIIKLLILFFIVKNVMKEAFEMTKNVYLLGT